MRSGNVKHWRVHHGEYWHHLVDFREYPLARRIWGDRCIVELVRNPSPGVRRITWQAVMREAAVHPPVLVRQVDKDLKTVLRRAKRKLDSNFYCVVRYNCEHFAYECLTGRRRSRQVEKTALQVFLGLLFAAGCVVSVNDALNSVSAGASFLFCTSLTGYCTWRVTSLARAGSHTAQAYAERNQSEPAYSSVSN